MGISEEERKELFEAMMTENVPKLMSDTNPQIQKAQTTPSRINANKTTPRYISCKRQKI